MFSSSLKETYKN